MGIRDSKKGAEAVDPIHECVFRYEQDRRHFLARIQFCVGVPVVLMRKRSFVIEQVAIGRRPLLAQRVDQCVVTGLLLTMEAALVYGVTPLFLAVVTLPLIALALAGVSLAVAAYSWQHSAWAPISLAVYTIGLAAMAVFGWWLHYWNLLGWRRCV